MNEWWSIPCSRRFLRSVIDPAADGQCVIVIQTCQTPPGMADAIAGGLDERGIHHQRLFADEISASDPCEWLHLRFTPDSPGTARTVSALADHPGLSGVTFIVDLEDAPPAGWCEFLRQHAQVIRTRPVFERSLFIVLVRLSASDLPPSTDSCLVTRHHDPAPRAHEMRLLLALADDAGSDAELVESLRQSIIVELAQSDPLCCAWLARRALGDLLAPQAILATLANERLWHQLPEFDDPGDETARRQGITCIWGGRRSWHSAWLALRNLERELRRRLWRAQLSVLFPFIEEQRITLIETHPHLLRVPFATDFGVIAHRHDLEIGHIAHLLRQRSREAGRSIADTASWLAEARNRLAHGEVLDPTFASRPGSVLRE